MSFDQNEIAELLESLPAGQNYSRLCRILGIVEKRPGATGSPLLSMLRSPDKEKKRPRRATYKPAKKVACLHFR
ncbi:hypothetical protein MLD38_016432 [Melastoma candidum]|uniref:Uncharacterized protein n=1 Tax=Melastoma candidum TaxID=119954 RepID=A0ACB9RSV5_9MYRT|nr:hypothetical protein MLD38_016432 [Melastoma candidum]